MASLKAWLQDSQETSGLSILSTQATLSRGKRDIDDLQFPPSLRQTGFEPKHLLLRPCLGGIRWSRRRPWDGHSMRAQGIDVSSLMQLFAFTLRRRLLTQSRKPLLNDCGLASRRTPFRLSCWLPVGFFEYVHGLCCSPNYKSD